MRYIIKARECDMYYYIPEWLVEVVEKLFFFFMLCLIDIVLWYIVTWIVVKENPIKLLVEIYHDWQTMKKDD
jgi:hypothetical protein